MLVGEENHDVLAREVLFYLIGQSFKRILIRHRSLTCCHHDEEMVVVDGGSQFRQSHPVLHLGIVGTRFMVAVVHILPYQLQRVAAPVELNATFQVHRHARQSFQPAKEPWLELRP